MTKSKEFASVCGHRRKAGSRLFDFLFPTPCACCLKPAGRKRFLCRACEASFSFYPTENVCKLCGAPVVTGGDICGRCLAFPYAYEQLVVCSSYSGALRTALHRYKFYGRADLAPSFALMLYGQLIRAGATDFDAVVPVPLSKERLAQRGFNQAELIAKQVAKAFGVPCISSALVRKRDTKQQALLRRSERSKNIRGAFALCDTKATQGLRLLLVDDIYTSGATMGEAAKVLARAAKSVIACVIAKTTGEKE